MDGSHAFWKIQMLKYRMVNRLMEISQDNIASLSLVMAASFREIIYFIPHYPLLILPRNKCFC